MNKVFDFSDIANSEATISKTWNDFREDLKNHKYKYDDLDLAKQSVFLKVFDDLFTHGYSLLEKSVGDVLSVGIQITRASHLKNDEPSPTYDRIMPIAEHITKHNRFSPPGVEWIYLAFGSGNKDLFSNSETCALRECRANVGDRMAICDFILKKEYSDYKVVDLTIAKSLTYEDFNYELENAGEQICKREYNECVNRFLKEGILKKSAINVTDIIQHFIKWSIYTYAKLLAENIFLPINSEDREIIYAPFLCLAQHFKSKGYSGIVYSSTVFPEGKNIVLFNKNIVEPYGKVKDIIYS